MSGGAINVDPNTAVAQLAVATPIFTMGAATTINWTGGTITIIDPHSVSAGTAYTAAASTGATLITGGTLNIGDGTSTTASGATANTNGFGLSIPMGVWNLNINNRTDASNTRIARMTGTRTGLQSDHPASQQLFLHGVGGARTDLVGKATSYRAERSREPK